MLDRYIVFTNLLVAFSKEVDEEKKNDIKYQLMLLEEGFKPVFKGKELERG